MRPIRCLPLITIYCCLYLINLTAATEHDFQFNDDDTEHHEEISTKKTFQYNKKFINNNNKSIYSLDISKCPSTENKIMLTLVLKSNDWKDLVANKRNRIINKLSKFFAISKEFIRLESINRRDLYDMTKRSIKRGPNKCNINRQLGKIEFVIGCGQSYFKIGELISNQIAEQMRDGSIDDITRIDFGWWVIWRKRISNRVPRSKRENKLEDEGSGDYDAEDYEYEDDDLVTEVPAIMPTTTAHAHRHHHGVSKTDFIDGDVKNIPIDIPNTLELTNIKYKKNDIKSQPPPSQPIDDDIVKQLESVITKTIENTEKIKPLEESTTSSIASVINIDDDDEDSDDDDDDEYLIEEDVLMQSKIISSTDSSIKSSLKPTTEKSSIENENVEISTSESTTKLSPVHIPISTSTISNIDNKPISSSLPYNEPSMPTISTVTIPSAPIEEITTSSQNTLTNSLNSNNYRTTTISSSSVQSVKNTDETTVETTLTDDSIYDSASTRNIINKLINENKFETTSTSPIYLVKNFLPNNNNNNNNYINPSTISNLNISDFVTEQSPITVSTTTIPKTITTLSSTSATILVSTPNILTTISETTLASNNMGKDYNENQTDSSKDDEISFEATPGAAGNRDDDLSFEGNLTNSVIESTSISPPTTTTIATTTTSTEFIEPKPRNSIPVIRNRLPKQVVTAGKPFIIKIPRDTFYDAEDEPLKHELLDKNNENLDYYSWIQYREADNDMYGLPLDETVSKYEFKLKATDSQNGSVTEEIQIIVQQHKTSRSANHEIAIDVKLNKKYPHYVNWQMQLLESISSVLKDDSFHTIVVRSVAVDENNPNNVVLKYFNETLPRDYCPEKELKYLLERLNINSLNQILNSEITVKSIKAKLINSCETFQSPPPTIPTITTKNHPPVPRNPVDRVNATVGHLLVFKVPYDTFYDQEDTTNLKLYVLTADRDELPPRHWLQFDSKNQEFYGIPKAYGTEQYLLVAEDRGGLKAVDALEVVIGHPIRREYSILFKAYLGIRHEQFTPAMQRKFIEKVARVFKDSSAQYIQIRSITTHHDTDGTIVNFYNTTLFRSHMRCPEDEIENVRLVWFSLESNLRDSIKNEMNEFSMKNLQMLPLTSCYYDPPRNDIIPLRPDDASNDSFTNEYLYTFILPAVIILFMIILASIVACVLHRRRITGKMELGDEEERKSFRSKGIPVIFQDELDEKPEIGNKSPIILKDEKPPLLPPSYNSTNVDGDNDCDEYVPPPAVVLGGREIRGKSPVTPSYRKPPPYVSP